jgi:kumamolisin
VPSPKEFIPIAHSGLQHVAGARLVGRINPNETAEVLLYVRSAPSGGKIRDAADELGNMRVRERTHFSRSRFVNQFGADPADLEAVERFANENNLSVSSVGSARRSVRLIGTLGDLQKAFNVQMAQYHSSRGTYRGYAGTVHVPHELSDIVKSVFGLDTKPQVTSHLRMLPNMAGRAGARAGANGYTPVDVASLYNFPSGYYGQGQTVALLEFGGGYRMDDLNAYFQGLGIAAPSITSVSVGGGRNAPTGNSNGPDAEVMLDIEVLGAVASGARIVVYFAPNTTMGFLRAVSTAIHDSFHSPSIISISWGGPESSWSRLAMNAMNYEFQSAAALGITVCAAAGDNGYTDGIQGTRANVDFPASSPYVLACGGTRLESSGGAISSEVVWYDNPNSATGGGVSDHFGLPSYQQNANVPTSVNPPYNTGRGVPDVSGDADPVTGYRVRVDGQNLIIGGTSAVAPLWAGLLALINQKLDTSVGYINPILYSQGPGGLNDILHGNNGSGGYKAGPGWDACTGLGSPNGEALAGLL